MGEILDKIGQLVRDPSVQVDMTGFVFALAMSALMSIAVSALYQIFYENRSTGSQIHRSFLLMGPSITALFIAVQFSLPLSLGLLGALSIIRFRTPVKEPEEIGFVMLLVACAVVTATFQFLLLLTLLVIAFAFLLGQSRMGWLRDSKRTDGMLLLVVDGDLEADKRAQLLRFLEDRITRGRLQGIAFSEGKTTLHYSFTGLPDRHLDGIEIGLRSITPLRKLNLYFNGQGSLI
jgi:hypothetical protein